MVGDFINSKGQIVSVEYILIIALLFFILVYVMTPMIGKSIDASMDISKVSDAKVAAQEIAHALDVVYSNGPGAKRTVTVYVPDTTNLTVSGNNVTLQVTCSDKPRNVTTFTQYNFPNISLQLNKGWNTVVVEWPIGGTITISKV